MPENKTIKNLGTINQESKSRYFKSTQPTQLILPKIAFFEFTKIMKTGTNVLVFHTCLKFQTFSGTHNSYNERSTFEVNIP